NKRFAVTAADRVLALSSLSFDLSVYDIFGLLAAGGAIVVPDATAARGAADWTDMIRRERVTSWSTVPALMEILTEDAKDRGSALPDSLRLVMMSGDWIPVGLPDQIRELAQDARIVSLGGATEASIWSILFEIDSINSEWKSIPYGYPMINQSWQVLNERLEP